MSSSGLCGRQACKWCTLTHAGEILYVTFKLERITCPKSCSQLVVSGNWFVCFTFKSVCLCGCMCVVLYVFVCVYVCVWSGVYVCVCVYDVCVCVFICTDAMVCLQRSEDNIKGLSSVEALCLSEPGSLCHSPLCRTDQLCSASQTTEERCMLCTASGFLRLWEL